VTASEFYGYISVLDAHEFVDSPLRSKRMKTRECVTLPPPHLDATAHRVCDTAIKLIGNARDYFSLRVMFVSSTNEPRGAAGLKTAVGTCAPQEFRPEG